MPSERQRNKLYFDLRECDLQIGTEDAIKKMMSDDTFPAADACILVGYVSDLSKMRWAVRTGNYDALFAPKDMENVMVNLHDLITKYESK
ncbi:MAG: hypothetical protein WC763_05115 [Candidatus Paceibacterota bacterium]|jgi:hypothetical protein